MDIETWTSCNLHISWNILLLLLLLNYLKMQKPLVAFCTKASDGPNLAPTMGRWHIFSIMLLIMTPLQPQHTHYVVSPCETWELPRTSHLSFFTKSIQGMGRISQHFSLFFCLGCPVPTSQLQTPLPGRKNSLIRVLWARNPRACPQGPVYLSLDGDGP